MILLKHTYICVAFAVSCYNLGVLFYCCPFIIISLTKGFVRNSMKDMFQTKDRIMAISFRFTVLKQPEFGGEGKK